MSSSLRAILRSNKVVSAGLALIGLLTVGTAVADDEAATTLSSALGPTVSLRTAYWNRDKSYANQRNYLASSAWLSLRPAEFFEIKTFFDGYVASNDLSRAFDTPAGTSSKAIFEAREAYAERSFGALDLRVGRQIMVWGRADKANPTDQWTSKNLTLLTTDDEDQRLGLFSVNSTINFEDFRLIALYQPEWRFPIYPIPPISGVTLNNQQPTAPAQQFGLKLDRTGGDLDWSVSVSNVISRTPNLSVLSAGPGGTSLGLNYEFVRVYGGDFAFNLGGYGVRGELAYTQSNDRDGRDPLRFNSELYAVLGADRSFIENLNFNFQVLYKHVFGFQRPDSISDANTRLLASQQNLIANQLGADRFGLSFRPGYKMLNDTLEFELAYVQWFYEFGGLVRPKVTYAINDQLKVIAGGEAFFGQQESFFGRLAETSSLFTELRFSF
jgi:hypothetical protein